MALNIRSWAFPGSWGNVGFIPRPRPPAQRRTRPRRLRSPPACALLSPPRTASTPPSHPLLCCPEPWPLLQGHSPRSQAGTPALHSQATARLTPRPHTSDLWVARHPQSVHTTYPLPSMPSPPPSPSSKTLSHSSRPVQMSPPPGSLLRSQHTMGPSDFPSS